MLKIPSQERPARGTRLGLWWLAAVGVLALHLGTLALLWRGDTGQPAALTLAEGRPSLDATLTIPVTPVSATGPRQKSGTRPPAQTRTAVPLQEGAAAATPPAADSPAPVPEAGPQDLPMPAPDTESPPSGPTAPEPSAPTPAPAAVTATVPASLRLRYEVLGTARGLNYHADASLDWRQDGQRYEGRLEIGAFLIGSRVQTSWGRLAPEGLRPERFSDAVRRERRLSFDHETMEVRLDDGAPVPMPPGTQDRLSVFLQLAALLAASGPSPVGQRWQIPVAGLPRVETMTFVVDGSETLVLPAGEFQAVKLRREARREGGQQLELWLAPQLQYLPVRILLRELNGDSADQRLRAR